MSDDDDMAFAMFLQAQFDCEDHDINTGNESKLPTSLVDDAWEVIDPVPDIRQLFLQFNDEYFDGLLGGVEVRWSPRMTLCAGLCCYEGRGGLCSVRLSEPLLKLRPRKDLVQTLLHEMIHALLFVTQNNKDHDGHGPEFHKHMYRINKQSGTNITVYHNFHDEVNSYRLHWWKCNGPCQKWSPFYGVVKRAMNRAPAPRDTWWDDHKRKCGGDFTKVKEPENYGKKKPKKKTKNTDSGLSKEKGNMLGAGKPSLPTFFDRMKKKQVITNGSILTENDCKGINQDINGIQNEIINGDSCDEDSWSPAKKQKTEGAMLFSGVGNVLGGSKSGQGRTQGLMSTGDKNTLEDKKKEPFSSSQKTLSTEKYTKAKNRKKIIDTNQSRLTIIDAFKRSEDSQGSSKSGAPEGSKYKPINLCEENSSPGLMPSSSSSSLPSSSLPSSSSSSSLPSSSSCDVSCPICQLVVPITKINVHLDNCLTTI